MNFDPQELWLYRATRENPWERLGIYIYFSNNLYLCQDEALQIICAIPCDLKGIKKQLRVTVEDYTTDKSISSIFQLVTTDRKYVLRHSDDYTYYGVKFNRLPIGLQQTITATISFDGKKVDSKSTEIIRLNDKIYCDVMAKSFEGTWNNPLYLNSPKSRTVWLEENESASPSEDYGLPLPVQGKFSLNGILQRLMPFSWNRHAENDALPFDLRFSSSNFISSAKKVPRFDLIKIDWLLRIAIPLWRSAAFASKEVNCDVSLLDNQIVFELRASDNLQSCALNLPEFQELINDSLEEDIDCAFYNLGRVSTLTLTVNK